MHKNLSKPLLEIPELINKFSQGFQGKRLRVVNANYPLKMPAYTVYNPPVKADHIFANERIPLARHIDLSSIGDKSEGLPCMLPDQNAFKELMAELDIGKDDHIVCYGDDNIIGACRAFWMFKVFGAANTSILNGTLSQWKQAQGAIEVEQEAWRNNRASRMSSDFDFEFNKQLVEDMNGVHNLINKQRASDGFQLIDTRKSTAFKGEPSGPRKGHIPGFKNLAFVELLRENGGLKPRKELENVLLGKGYSLDKPTVVSCNSGMTASVLYCTLYLLGMQNNLRLYDGSWSEWAKHVENPIAQGEH